MVCGMLRGASSKGHMQREGGCAVVRRGHLTAVVGTFLIGCAVLLLGLGCAGTSSEPPRRRKNLPKPSRRSKHVHPKLRPLKKRDARGHGPSSSRASTLPRTIYPSAPRAARSWAPTKQTNRVVRRVTTRYVALAPRTRSSEELATTSSPLGRATTLTLPAMMAMLSSTVGMATI